MPTVPVSVWEQIPVVVVYTLLLCALGLAMVKTFKDAITEINRHYLDIVEKNNTVHSATIKESNELHAASIKASNEQWQNYFNARSETNQLINTQVVKELGNLTAIIQELVEKFDNHDLMERQALDEMSGARKLSKKP